jgi:hypothetical protein
VRVAKNANCPLNPLVKSLFFAVIVLAASQVHRDRVTGVLKNIISRKNECTRHGVLSVETNVKCPFDLLVENQFTVATVLGRVITREVRALNSIRNSSK